MDTELFFANLAEDLRAVKRKKLATQLEIEEKTGVAQATISRVMNGKVRRITESIERLKKYVNMLLSEDDVPATVKDAAREFLGRGGSEAELIASIEHSANLVTRKII